MKVVASNIFDFTTWYKFGHKFIPYEIIIDLADAELSGEDILKKTGFFEEEYEVFFLEISETQITETAQSLFLSFHDIKSLIPLTEKGGKLLATKIPDFKISSSAASIISLKLIEARNKHLSIQGGNRLISAFGIAPNDQLKKYQDAFMISLLKYFKDLDAEQDSVLDNIVFYERAKPYPLSDIGFLFDVGAIARARFHLTDEDFKNKSQLQSKEPNKYELIEEVIALSKYLQSKNIEKVWPEFINEYASNEEIRRLSSDLSLIEFSGDINNILVIAFYLKFRNLIRDTSSIEDRGFVIIVNQFLSKVPVEAEIALFLVGMFFGALKFKELFYKYVPLHISRHAEFDSRKKNEKEEAINQEKIKKKIDGNSIKQSPELHHILTNSKSDLDEFIFDEVLWRRLNLRLLKFTPRQNEIIKNCYFEVVNSKGDQFTSHPELMINMLKKKMKTSKATKLESKLSPEIIQEVKSILGEFLSQ